MNAAAPRTVPPSAGALLPRLASAIALRRDFYDAVAADPHATGPAAGIVCLTALARESVGLWSVAEVHPAWGLAAVSVVIIALLGWLAYGACSYVLARLISTERVEFTRLLRCLGFAESVTVLRLIAFVVDPRLFLPLHLALLGWGCAAVCVAVRAAVPTARGRWLAIAIPTFIAQQLVLAVGRALAY
jgi:hypothetical protein